MVKYIVAILGAVVVFLLAIFKGKTRETRELKEEKEKAEERCERREEDLERVKTVSREIKRIDEEEKREEVKTPVRGDSSSRLMRLNRLQDSANATRDKEHKE